MRNASSAMIPGATPLMIFARRGSFSAPSTFV
jgi:hypothetical protein